MSSEHRVVRPYVGLERFQAVLDDWRLRVGPEVAAADERLTLTSATFLNDPLLLRCASDDDHLDRVRKELLGAAEAIDLEALDLEVVVLARSPYLRLADVVHRATLDRDDALAREIVLSEPRPRAFCTPSGGCDVEAYLVLARDLTPGPLRPKRKGTWLGRIAFKLRTELGELGFTPRPLTPEKREELRLPAGTVRYVSVEAESLEGESLDDVVVLYVDVDVLAVLNQSPGTPAARSFQRQLFLDVVGAIVRNTRGIPDFDELTAASLEPSVMTSLIEAVAGRRQRGESDQVWNERRGWALNMLRSEPDLFMAHLEDLADPRADLRTTIAGLDR